MNLMYYRTTKLSPEKVIENIRKSQTEINIIGETKLKNGIVFHFRNDDWYEKIASIDMQLIGIVPSIVVVVHEGDKTQIGVPNASVLSTIASDPQIKTVAELMSKALISRAHSAAEIEELKVTGVKIFSTTTCPYCKMEEAWLKENKIEYDLSLVDMNQTDAQYMVEKTGQMGVPVTEIKYDESESEFIIGFDKARLAQVLHI